MNVLVITVFVSLILAVAGVLLFVSRVREGDFEHGDRLSLLPLGDDVESEPTEDLKEDPSPPKADEA